MHVSRAAAACILLGGLSMLPSGGAHADAAANVSGAAISSTDGGTIYSQVCQGCHMANAKGGVGAAVIPALAGNAKLKSSGYPIYIVLNGHGAMPWLSGTLNDAQIASVVSYVRSHFGNGYTDAVKPEDVAAVRGPEPVVER